MKQAQYDPPVTNQSSRSNDHIFMLNTIKITVPTLTRLSLAPLNFADNYSFRSTNKTRFQTNTNLNATADPSQTLYQPPTARNIGPFASLPSSSSVLNVNPIEQPPVVTQNYTVFFVA